MISLVNDTLKNNNKWSQKRLMTFSSFFVATIYAFIPIFLPNFEVKEFVFLGFLGVGGFSIYRTQKTNENINNNTLTE